MDSKMFCFQCQETLQNKGCTKIGVCGKKPDVAFAQDLLIYATKTLSIVTTQLRAENKKISAEVNQLVTLNLFTTITNANFDAENLMRRVDETLKVKAALLEKISDNSKLPAVAKIIDRKNFDESKIGVLATENEDIRSLRELITYGLKGMAAYLYHANALGYDDEKINAFMQSTLAKLLDDTLSGEDLTALALETGKVGVDTMALLDKANTSTYGNPEISKVNIGVRKNPAILISGHDFKDLEQLLEQTEGTGIDVYTHGEMLSAHYYPAFKKYNHFVGNYGNAWHLQQKEFEKFNGVILLTTNCLVPPKESYKARVFTTGAVAYPNCKHVEEVDGKKNFTPLIELAKTLPPPTELETGEIIGGFAHEQVFALADNVVDAVKSGAIKKFIVMGGCDGRQKSREYYTEFAKALPKDTVILTCGCAKYKFIKLNLGDIGGVPRILDAGQCNDSYSLALIALKLKEVFGLDDVNKLPIVYNISHYEQKATLVLLALLYLGVKNIHLGPTLPAYVSPNVAKVLVENFGIGTISTVNEDIKNWIG
ncbi:MAG: hydroxylamine reductase [Selenomonadaceae bacterium]|nr:hydroxylamine reductase [Selenomonadaceae bacterium]